MPIDELGATIASVQPGEPGDLDATQAPREPPTLAPTGDRLYLLVMDGDSSWIAYLPRGGEAVIGRGDDADVRLANGVVSRRHAKITVAGGEARLVDLGSHNGTRVNGERVVSARTLAPGDVVSLCTAILVFQRRVRFPAHQELVGLPLARQRVEEEVERALRYHRRFSVAVIDAAGADRQRVAAAVTQGMRLLDCAAWLSPTHLLAVLPELAPDEAAATTERLIRAIGAARGGVAGCPDDACDGDTLIEAARSSLDAAEPGAAVTAARAVTAVDAGGVALVCADGCMLRIVGMLRRLAAADAPLLLYGEAGVGKRSLAASVHHWSPRARGPLVEVDCASDALGEDHVALAHRGTLLLREVCALPPAAQERLLRLLLRRPIEVRVLATSRRRIEEEARTPGRLLPELTDLLGARAVMLPPLRDRPREIPVLARHFAAQAARRLGRALDVAPGAMRALAEHTWPTNLHELREAIDRAADRAAEGALEAWMLPSAFARPAAAAAPALDTTFTGPPEEPRRFRRLSEEVAELERRRIAEALGEGAGSAARAAALLGIPLHVFEAKQRQYGL